MCTFSHERTLLYEGQMLSSLLVEPHFYLALAIFWQALKSSDTPALFITAAFRFIRYDHLLHFLLVFFLENWKYVPRKMMTDS